MSTRDLDAAGIADPGLRDSYELCRRLNAAHGRTYYLATLLLPRAKRPYVHALYGFARYADEIVDDLDSELTAAERATWLRTWSATFLSDLESGQSEDPVCSAVIDTARRWDIPTVHFEAFLRSMEMDLTVTDYATYDDLYEYVYGSAAVIGLQVTPILEPTSPDAARYAVDLGVAFQLVNFVRDVGEDLDRGRVYLPTAELARFGVDRDVLERRVATPAVRAALAFQVQRVRELAERSRAGVPLLAPSSRPCIDAARDLYCGIADEVERAGYDVFTSRATVPRRRRLVRFVRAWSAARLA